MAGPAVEKEVTDLRLDLANQVVPGWKMRWVNPYKRCYHQAFKNYQDTIDRQIASDKFKMELMVTVMSIVGGSIAGAVFGKTAGKEIAGEMAADLIRQNNLKRATDLVSKVEKSVAAKFALGEVWDTARDQLSDGLKKRLTDNITRQYKGFSTFTNNPVLDPAVVNTFLDDFINDNQITIDQAAQDIRDMGGLSDEQRLQSLRKLRKSTFFRVPPTQSDEKTYRRQMELTLWMRHLLGTDRLVVSSASSSNGAAVGYRRGKPKPIHQNPNAGNYPSSRILERRVDRGFLPFTGDTYVKRQDVEFGRIGGDINIQINKVHKALYGHDFFFNVINNYELGQEANSRNVLRRAERRLRQLAMKSDWKH